MATIDEWFDERTLMGLVPIDVYVRGASATEAGAVRVLQHDETRLLTQVEAGEEVIIARAGRPVARLVPYEPADQPRQPGAMRGHITVPDDFDATPEEMIDEFEGGTR
jgi:prevent-host-death family protein